MTKNQKNVEQFYSEQTPLSPASSKLNWEVMRSIDPDSYRNIELEVWEECRKGTFLASIFQLFQIPVGTLKKTHCVVAVLGAEKFQPGLCLKCRILLYSLGKLELLLHFEVLIEVQ